MLTLFLCALVGFVLAEWFKRLANLKAGRHGWAKLVMALFGAALVAGLTFRRDTQDVAIYAVAGAGLAMVIHKVYRALSAKGDDLITDIIAKRRDR
jgi:hypothetical protein